MEGEREAMEGEREAMEGDGRLQPLPPHGNAASFCGCRRFLRLPAAIAAALATLPPSSMRSGRRADSSIALVRERFMGSGILRAARSPRSDE